MCIRDRSISDRTLISVFVLSELVPLELNSDPAPKPGQSDAATSLLIIRKWSIGFMKWTFAKSATALVEANSDDTQRAIRVLH